MKFNWNITGHSQQMQYLQKQIVSGRINHAYLFIGRKNLSLINIVDQFIKAIACSSDEIKPCGKCSNCRDIHKKKYSDLIYINPLKNSITVSQIRQLKVRLSKKPWFDKWQFVIIKEADTLNIQAANALLKNLEEPAKTQVIILITDNTNIIPKTILSRCQKIQFLQVPKKIAGNLKKEKKYLDTYSNLVDLLLMPNIANKINFTNKKISAEIIKEYLHYLQIIFQDIIYAKINLPNMISDNNAIHQLNKLKNKYSFSNINSINKELKFINDNLFKANPKILLENFIINYLK